MTKGPPFYLVVLLAIGVILMSIGFLGKLEETNARVATLEQQFKQCCMIRNLDPAPLAAQMTTVAEWSLPQTLEQRMSTLEGKVHNCCSIYTREDPTYKNTVLLRKIERLERRIDKLEQAQ